MKVKIIQQFTIPNQPDFIVGDDYDIMEPLASTLHDRGLVAVYPKKKEDDQKPEKKQITK